MYTPPHYREADLTTLREFIQRYNFGLLVSLGPEGLEATHLPMLLEVDRGLQGVLVGHMARANRQWEALEGAQEVLAVFSGPHAYVSPTWYVSPPGVPTWNYAAVHVYGRARLVQSQEELHEALVRLVAAHEQPRPKPWSSKDVSPDYYQGRLKGIVGFEIEITRMQGKKKLSQNRSLEDQAAVARALEEQGDEQGREVARLMLEGLP
jgi:transcriptional regulator